jgi:D-amino-acid oxidase
VVKRVAIIGAGVSGLTCGVLFAEAGFETEIFAAEIGGATTSAAAGAIWFPYDAEPAEAVIKWSLQTYAVLRDLTANRASGVSMLEFRVFTRRGQIPVPRWAVSLGAESLQHEDMLSGFASGFSLWVPVMDTTIYLDYLRRRYEVAGGKVHAGVSFDDLGSAAPDFPLLINCAGIGGRTLVPDREVEPHRGQVVLVQPLDVPYAVACDDPPLMYAIPRTHDCVFGGTNEVSFEREPSAADTERIVAECSRALGLTTPSIVGERVGLRPFRRSGVCLRRTELPDGRAVIHNYGHGGAGFTLSWGCAQAVLAVAEPVPSA